MTDNACPGCGGEPALLLFGRVQPIGEEAQEPQRLTLRYCGRCLFLFLANDDSPELPATYLNTRKLHPEQLKQVMAELAP